MVLGLFLAWNVQAEELTPQEKGFCNNAKKKLHIMERVKPSNVTTAIQVCIDQNTDLKNLKNFNEKYKELSELELKVITLRSQYKLADSDLINRVNTLRIAKIEEMKQYSLTLRSQLGIKMFVNSLMLFALGSTNFDDTKKVDNKTVNDINFAFNVAVTERLNEVNRKFPKMPKSLRVDVMSEVPKFILFLKNPNEFIKSFKKVYPEIIENPSSLKLNKFDCELLTVFGNEDLIKKNGLVCN